PVPVRAGRTPVRAGAGNGGRGWAWRDLQGGVGRLRGGGPGKGVGTDRGQDTRARAGRQPAPGFATLGTADFPFSSTPPCPTSKTPAPTIRRRRKPPRRPIGRPPAPSPSAKTRPVRSSPACPCCPLP